MRSGSRASLEPPATPVCELTIRARLSAQMIRRMTTGLVLTLSAASSEVSAVPGSRSRPTVRRESRWTATVKRELIMVGVYL